MTDNQTSIDTPHGNVGKRNAAKPVTAESNLHIRCLTADKTAWVRQAQQEGLTLAAWVTRTLNSAATD